jgi:ComF family protein
MVRVRSLGPYTGPVARLVRALKYDGWRLAGDHLARRLARAVVSDPALSAATVASWVPSTRGRERERGFNPAELLARGACARIPSGPPPAPLLRRVREGPRQAGLPASERQGNVRGAFAPDPGALATLPHSHVLLVDDVLTTGSTVSEAARVLVGAGASTVSVLTVARALETSPDRAPDAS